MKDYVFSFILCNIILPIQVSAQSYASPPDIIWQDVVQANGTDQLASIDIIPSGGFYVVGYSTSDAGFDKTESTKGYWVIRYDASKHIFWNNALGGGAGVSKPVSIKTLPDNGCIVGGYSNTGITVDKSEASFGENDYWIVKLDALGSPVWENTIGGSGNDILTALELTPDGGFIAGGYSNSGISGDKTDAAICVYGDHDYWIIKCDENGDIEWQKTIGTCSDDVLQSIVTTSDGGYILAGNTPANISGDKTQAGFGGNDYWMVKLNAEGDIEWDKGYGGPSEDKASAIIQLPDNGYIVAGYSNSNTSAVKSENTLGSYDYWILRLKSNGNLKWENTLGGTSGDYATCVDFTEDGIVVGGYSTSPISADKSDPVFGIIRPDYWVIKLDLSGKKIWDNVIEAKKSDYMRKIIYMPNQTYLLAGDSDGTKSGDKDENSKGTDFWIVQLDKDPPLCDVDPTIFTDGDTIFCPGGNALLSTIESDTLSYHWYLNYYPIPGSSGSSLLVNTEGIYKVAITNGTCNILSEPIQITSTPDPVAMITNLDAFDDVCIDPSIQLKANVGDGLTYKWLLNGDFIVGATAVNYFVTAAGDYSVLVTDAFGCIKFSEPYTIYNSCRLINNTEHFSVYPNPSNGKFQITFSKSIQDQCNEVNVINTRGEIIFSKAVCSQDNINMELPDEVQTGMYIIQIISGDAIYNEQLLLLR